MWAGAKVHDCIERKWGIDPENVKLIEYNLFANQGAEFTVRAAEIENTKTYIAGSMAVYAVAFG